MHIYVCSQTLLHYCKDTLDGWFYSTYHFLLCVNVWWNYFATIYILTEFSAYEINKRKLTVYSILLVVHGLL
jgi:hypothetical protein